MDYSEILIGIRKIVRSINLESKKVQGEYGVSIPQILSLNYLQKCPEYISSQNDIRIFLNLNSSTITGIINRLEKKGLVARLPKSGDKRINNVVLTSTGDALIKKIPPLLHEQLSRKLEKQPEEKLIQIKESLNLLTNLFEIEEIKASPIISLEDEIIPEE
jgi:DNA-binding MarR family transcriptional regulator